MTTQSASPEDRLEKLTRMQRRPDSVTLRTTQTPSGTPAPEQPETQEAGESDGLSVKFFDDDKHNEWMSSLLNRWAS